MSIKLSPETDFSVTFPIQEFDPVAGDYAPITTGVVRCYFAYARLDDDAIDPQLDGPATHIGGHGPQPVGTWFFGVDGALLTLEFLDDLLLADPEAARPVAVPLYLIIIKQNGIRVSYAVKYVRDPKGAVA